MAKNPGSGTSKGVVSNRSVTRNADGSVTVRQERTVTRQAPPPHVEKPREPLIPHRPSEPFGTGTHSFGPPQPSPSATGYAQEPFDAGVNGNFNSGPEAVARYPRMAREIGGETAGGTGRDRTQLAHDSEFLHRHASGIVAAPEDEAAMLARERALAEIRGKAK